MGHIDVVKYLLGRGADINAIDMHEDTALHVAAHYGRFNVVNVVKYLLDKGANIEAINDEGKTALHEAAQERNLNVVKCLLSHKARICAKSFNVIKDRFFRLA